MRIICESDCIGRAIFIYVFACNSCGQLKREIFWHLSCELWLNILILTGLKSIFATSTLWVLEGKRPFFVLAGSHPLVRVENQSSAQWPLAPRHTPYSVAFQVQRSSHTAGKLGELQHVWRWWSACDSQRREMTFQLRASAWQLWCQFSLRGTKLCRV